MNVQILAMAILALAVAAVALFLVGWLLDSRPVRHCSVVVLIMTLIGLVGLVSTGYRCIWDGGYLQAEFRLTFQDEEGRPVEGVGLRVEDVEGNAFFHYPVTDYLPDRIPTSNGHGVMTFHHFPGGLEFSGEITYLFFAIPIENRRGPVYVCRFLHQGQEVHRAFYGELDHCDGTWETAPKVKRRWAPPAWQADRLFRMHAATEKEAHARVLELFDVNHNGKLDPEEIAAFGATMSEEAAFVARAKGCDPSEEAEFLIVTKTIVVHRN